MTRCWRKCALKANATTIYTWDLDHFRLSRAGGSSDRVQDSLLRLRRSYSFTFRKRSEFVITETELRLIAAAARIGLSNRPKNG